MLNCAWQNLYWWHGFTCCCRGRDDYLGVGTSSSGSSGDGVVCTDHGLMARARWGWAGEQLQNELPYTVLSVCLYPGGKTTTSISVPLLLTAPSGVSPSIPLSCVKPQDWLSWVSKVQCFLTTVVLQKFRWCSSREAFLLGLTAGGKQNDSHLTNFCSLQNLNQPSEIKWVASCSAGAQKGRIVSITHAGLKGTIYSQRSSYLISNLSRLIKSCVHNLPRVVFFSLYCTM